MSSRDEAGPPPAQRPSLPASYGISPSASGLLTWDFVDRRLAQARNYWVATTRPDGHPHVSPVWGLWLDHHFYFATGATSRKWRNLMANPALIVHLESGDEVVILEGTAERVLDDDVLTRLDEAYEAKYGVNLLAGGEAPNPIVALRLHKALAWLESDFPNTATRWLFDK
ncbi:MAG: pyridoxamine 5'-phosphate oxidase family protein [Candidatus Promineifilaceae bacterium]|nr:pyridoxamine 5'-phosphate oxidase family protein [Candidatus Promineifilaceae bacterium]